MDVQLKPLNLSGCNDRIADWFWHFRNHVRDWLSRRASAPATELDDQKSARRGGVALAWTPFFMLSPADAESIVNIIATVLTGIVTVTGWLYFVYRKRRKASSDGSDVNPPIVVVVIKKNVTEVPA